MKKITALVLAFVLCLSMTVTAFASDVGGATSTTTLNIYDKSTYTGTRDYAGYQILFASVSGSEYAYQVNTKYKDVLIDVLGLTSSATDAQIITAIQAQDTAEEMVHFSTALYRAIQAEDLAFDLNPEAEAWVETPSTKSITVEQGYWLIADVTDLNEEEYSNSLVMVDTVGDKEVTITNKPDDVTSEKKSDDEDDSVVAPVTKNEDEVTLQDVTDYDIGDLVPYQISGQLPNNIAEYDYYMFMIGDSVEQGLTFQPNTFAITVNGEPKTIAENGIENVDFWYEIETDTGDNGEQTAQRLYVYPAHGYTTHDGVKKEADATNGGDFLKLFDDDADHSDINSSTFRFTYNCLLNDNAVIGVEGNPNKYTLTYSNNPFDDSFGQSVPDITITLTYKVIVNKVDGDGQELKGADFEVYKFVAELNVTDEEKATAVELVNLKTTEDTLNAVTDKTLIHHPGANAYGYLEEVEKKTTNATSTDAATQFTFIGMDAGYYRLVETVTPAGYNGIAPVDFHVVADHDTVYVEGNPVLNSLVANTRVPGQMDMIADLEAGSLTATIENHSGDELPSTGGIGTTLFYIIGGVLALGAVVLLVTKKRMNAEG